MLEDRVGPVPAKSACHSGDSSSAADLGRGEPSSLHQLAAGYKRAGGGGLKERFEFSGAVRIKHPQDLLTNYTTSPGRIPE